MPRTLSPTLPFEPLAEEFPGMTNREIGEQCGVGIRQIIRWEREGVPASRADEIACKIGVHPMTLWGQEWTVAEIAYLEACEQRRTEALAAKAARQRRYTAERAAWKLMESRWAQWDAQQDRNANDYKHVKPLTAVGLAGESRADLSHPSETIAA